MKNRSCNSTFSFRKTNPNEVSKVIANLNINYFVPNAPFLYYPFRKGALGTKGLKKCQNKDY